MANGNPIDEALEAIEPVTGPFPETAGFSARELDDPDENPLDMALQEQGLLFAPGEEGAAAPTNFTPGAAFTRGVGRGVLEPFQILGAEPGEEDLGHPVAETLGELTGIGISFIPFFKGTQMAIKGVGLAKGMSDDAIRAYMGTVRGQATTGGLSFGAFEAGTAQELEDVPGEFAKGAAIGAVLDPAIMRTVEAAFGGASAATRKSIPKTFEEAAPETVVKVEPVAVSVERSLHPEKLVGIEEGGYAIRQLIEPESQVDEILAKVGTTFRPGGVAIVPAVQGPEKLIPALKKGLPEGVGITSRRTDEGLFEVLVADQQSFRDQLITKVQTKQQVTEAEEKLVQRFMGEGEPVLSFDEAVDLIRETSTEVIVTSEKKVSEIAGYPLYGQQRFVEDQLLIARDLTPPQATAEQAAEISEKVAYETLVHEYTHKFQTIIAGTYRGARGMDSPWTRVVAGQVEEPATLFDGGQLLEFVGREVSDETYGRLIDEMTEASIETLYRMRRSLKEFGYNDRSLSEKIVTESQRNYYLQDYELMSRTAELMFSDPKKARELAPFATEVIADAVQKSAPRLEKILTKEQRIIQEVIKQQSRETPVFARVPFEITPAMRKQFKRDGLFEGMEVIHGGQAWEVVSRVRPTRLKNRGKTVLENQFRLRDPFTGETKIVRRDMFQRPELPRLAQRQAEVVQKIDGLISEGPQQWVGATFRLPNREAFPDGARSLLDQLSAQKDELISSIAQANARGNDDLVRQLMDNISEIDDEMLEIRRRVMDEVPQASGDVVHGVVDISNFARTASLETWVRQNAPEAITGIRGRRPTPGPVTTEQAKLVARRQGFDGILVEDNGAYEVVIARPERVTIGETAVRESIDQTADAVLGATRFDLSFESVMGSLLREAGASQRELPHLMTVAERQYGRRLRDLMEPDVKAAVEGTSQFAKQATESIDDFAKRAGFKVDRVNGEIRLVHAENGSEVAAGLTEKEAFEYISKAGTESNSRVLSSADTDPARAAALGGRQTPNAGSKVPEGGVGVAGGGGGKPPRFQEVAMEKSGEELSEAGFNWTSLVEGSQLLGATITAMENFMKIAEERGLGPAFTRIFRPAQDARQAVDRALKRVERPGLGGKSYTEAMEDAAKVANQLSRDRKELVVDYIEFRTKDEIRQAGGLLQRPLNQTEINAAERFAALGVEHDIPRLQAVNKLATSLLENKEAFLRRSEDLLRQDIPDELRATIERLRGLADDVPDSREALLGEMRLSRQEQEAVNMIEVLRRADPDDASLFAIGRYASAPEKPAGVKSGQEWFARRHGMTKEEIQLANDLEQIYRVGFEEAGLDANRQIAGYWPHMRRYTEAGFTPDEAFIPDEFRWVSSRFRTGELNVYSKDPIATTYKYLRGLQMKKHFDPILPDVKAAISEVEAIDGRVGRIAKEYLDEILGRPHASFERVEEAIRSGMTAMGFDLKKEFVRRTVNTMTALAYGATIPFRPALIARNYYQMVQTIAPRTGMRDFVAGLGRALEDDGMRMARRAGAIPENVAPVHATSEVFEEGLIGNLGLGEKIDKLVRKGFDWYRSADEFGRAVAFHAQRSRVSRHMNDYMSGKIGWEQLTNRAKVKTFRPIDQREFANLVGQGKIEEAKNYLGSTLARETIFRYGQANHPAGWGGVTGRLFGQFGTWPVQYKDYLAQGFTRGTVKDKIEFGALHAATNLATVGAGAKVGMDLWNWVTFPSLQYTGGPFADIALNLVQAVGGSETERAMAVNNLKFQFPTMDDPRTIFLPLSYAVSDFASLAGEPNAKGAFQAFGFKFLQPGEESGVDRMLGPLR